MIEYSLKASGAKQQLKTLRGKGRPAMIKAVDEFQKIEMREMKKRTPVETGELQESGYTETPVVVGNSVEARMGFSAPHAMIVHEDLEAFHPIGQAKYMESVLNESRPHASQRIGESFSRNLKQ